MRQQDIWTATELSEEMIAAVGDALSAGAITPLVVAAWIVEVNTAEAALRAIPWEEIRWAAYQAGLFVEWTLDIKAVLDWCDANAPKEEETQP